MPSKILLDPPFPENLPVVSACQRCNNSFARDEEYVACLLESIIAGSTDPARMQRSRAGAILQRSPALRARLESRKTTVNGVTAFLPEPDRLRNVVTKLAVGHAAYELSLACRDEPASLRCLPLHLMPSDLRDEFEAARPVAQYGEVGSRGMQRLLVTQFMLQSPMGDSGIIGAVFCDWIEVQEGRYRYQATDSGDDIAIRIVIREYLACEVHWYR